MVYSLHLSWLKHRVAMLLAIPGAILVAFFIGVWTDAGPSYQVLSQAPVMTISPSGTYLQITVITNRTRLDLSPTFRYIGWYQDTALTSTQQHLLHTTQTHRPVLHQIFLDAQPLAIKKGIDINSENLLVPKDFLAGVPRDAQFMYWIEKRSACMFDIACPVKRSLPVHIAVR